MQALNGDGRVEGSIVAIDASQIPLTLSILLPVSSATSIANLFQSPDSQVEIQAAMRWWNQQRSHQSQSQADQIRDRLLQELFSLRRGLELATLNAANSDQHQQWLIKVEDLQQSLLNLSHQLSPPYLEASLPLAIQYEVEQWKAKYSQIGLDLHSAQPCQHNSLQHNRIIVEILNEWLKVHLSVHEPAIAITLNYQDHWMLKLQANYPCPEELEATLKSVELKHLNRVFELLISGKIEVRRQGQRTVWYFFWKEESHGLSM